MEKIKLKSFPFQFKSNFNHNLVDKILLICLLFISEGLMYNPINMKIED